jgi:hypothetical protein
MNQPSPSATDGWDSNGIEWLKGEQQVDELNNVSDFHSRRILFSEIVGTKLKR